MVADVEDFPHASGMTEKQLSGVRTRLDRFLEDLVEPMGRKDRRHWAQVYIQGLLLDGQRKSVQPIAERIGGGDEQALNQFLNQSPWEVTEIQRRLAQRLAEDGADPVYWVIDETSFPKAGEHSVGVARQYCGALGKIANCQVAVSLHWSSAEASCPLGWRLYLPEEWIEDAQRAQEVKVARGRGSPQPSGIGLGADRSNAGLGSAAGMPVVADSAYGNSFDFREELRQRQLCYVLAVEPSTVVWTRGSQRRTGAALSSHRSAPALSAPGRDCPLRKT